MHNASHQRPKCARSVHFGPTASPFIESITCYMAARRYSPRTIESYLYWIKYFIHFHGKRHPSELGGREIEQFLTFLTVERNVSAATQKLALNALMFLYNRFLETPLGDVHSFRRSKVPPKLPVVLSRADVSRLLSQLNGVPLMIASLPYGSGLRRIEVARLRVKDIDFDHLQIQVWNGKGFRHRLTTLAPELLPRLKNQVERVRLHLREDSLNEQFAGVWMLAALFLCHAFAGIGCRYSHRAGATRPPGCQNHRNLHPRTETWCPRGTQSAERFE